jgi:hypothetical protein
LTSSFGLQHPQPVADGDARRDDEEPLGEPGSRGVADLVEGLPGDQHAMTTVLPEPVAILRAMRGALVVGGVVKSAEPAAEVGLAVAARHLGQEDRRLGGLPLAEQHRLLARPSVPAQYSSSLRLIGVTHG